MPAEMIARRGGKRVEFEEALTLCQGLVKSARGEITVLNRKGLEMSAGESYGVPEKEYRRLFGK